MFKFSKDRLWYIENDLETKKNLDYSTSKPAGFFKS